MDSVFFLDEEARASFLRTVGQAFGCTYICLWSYIPHPSNCFFCMDGWYNEQNEQPSYSSGSLARRLFDDYQRISLHSTIENNCVPGLAFCKGLRYIELKELELLKQAWTDTQRQFYQEARIKTSAFMGCMKGEVELGMSILSQINMEMEMQNWFPENFSQQSPFMELPRPPDQYWPSSSLRSLSMDSPEYSSLLFNTPTTFYMPKFLYEAQTKPAPTAIMPHQQADDAAMARAMIPVNSSVSSSSSSYQFQQNHPYNYQVSQQKGAFKNYTSALASTPGTSLRRHNTRNEAITLRSLSSMRIQEQMQGSHPIRTRLHHKISESKRREKFNESFQALRSLLPPGSSKYMVPVLSSTKDYLSSLKAQVSELSEKNRKLEAQLSFAKEASGSSSRRIDVRVSTSELASEERNINLQVTVRGDCIMLNLVIIRILEFLEQLKNISLMSMEADTKLQQSNSINRVILRLVIQVGRLRYSS
ncbi:hypothetical protein HHK36_007104 [Tetracentron sinense]|uniref:BHLH domain-containing protein n=1 Tax=Tetracentron sinense TaxID=13715 RepID=A0A834ZIN9_TETSI|nr:hypothetical protein HHK36_007104 [Tetracentron sinense]